MRQSDPQIEHPGIFVLLMLLYPTTGPIRIFSIVSEIARFADTGIDAFRPHDLRRTLRSHLAGLGIQPHIAELCLNHSLGTIVQTYDVTSYVDERRDALDKWAGKVMRAVNPVENVVELSA